MSFLFDPIILIFILLLISVYLLRKTVGYGKYILLIATSLFYFVTIEPTTYLLVKSLENSYEPASNAFEKVDVIVVLGGGHILSRREGISGSEASIKRTLSGVFYFQRLKSQYLVFSTGNRGETGNSEAYEMAELAMKIFNLPQDKILLEEVSRNTWEHPEEIKKLFLSKNIQSKNLVSGLVTSAIHMPRALWVFKKKGYFGEIIPLPTDSIYQKDYHLRLNSFIPSTGNLSVVYSGLHELIGIVWYSVKDSYLSSYIY